MLGPLGMSALSSRKLVFRSGMLTDDHQESQSRVGQHCFQRARQSFHVLETRTRFAECGIDVRFWHLTDIEAEAGDVRFGVETGHHGPAFSCLLCAKSGLRADIRPPIPPIPLFLRLLQRVKYECLTGIKAHNTLPEGNSAHSGDESG